MREEIKALVLLRLNIKTDHGVPLLYQIWNVVRRDFHKLSSPLLILKSLNFAQVVVMRTRIFEKLSARFVQTRLSH